MTMSHAPQIGQVSDDLVHEPEEPPDERSSRVAAQSKSATFTKHMPTRIAYSRRESLLTRQLLGSGHDSHTEDEHTPNLQYPQAPSQSSMAELTSDNDLTSPGTRGNSPSPPFPPIQNGHLVLAGDKFALKEPLIMEQDESKDTGDSEKKVEDGLGRRRCISFACGKKDTSPAPAPPAIENKPTVQLEQPPPPKRKSMLTFNCPMRTKGTPPKINTAAANRHLSPAAPRSPLRSPRNRHRGSDTTVTSKSPVTLRKVSSFTKRRSKYVDPEDEEKLEAKRFHEFAVNSRADDDWTEESTCYQKRLTVKDTLQKENAIRQLVEEVEQEEEDEDQDLDDDAVLEDELDDLEDEDDEDDSDLDAISPRAGGPRRMEIDHDDDDDVVSDEGFDTDDEHGFANSSESEGDDSDFEWWAPGRSTAATSTEQMETLRPQIRRKSSDSSLESAREANGISVKARRKTKSRTAAVKIDRAPTPELPDSTDFVCGTLDEDRPLEQAYKLCLEQRKAAKRRAVPQDIDPTFPTSDPDMDEEDEEDEEDEIEEEAEGDDPHLFMPGKLELHEDRGRLRSDSLNKDKSKSPPRAAPSGQRHHNKSPAPVRRTSLRSPPPPVKRAGHRSPPPAKRIVHRSPPPPTNRARHRSPPPRKLFGHSPLRHQITGDTNRPTSPPNSVKSSQEGTPKAYVMPTMPRGLGTRPAPSIACSLPRVPTMTKMNMIGPQRQTEEDEDDDAPPTRIRGAIDIVKGLERKRQRRKEKLYQKHCQKLKKEGERKPKPGKGAERMRNLGLELAAYRGKRAEHMLSI